VSTNVTRPRERKESCSGHSPRKGYIPTRSSFILKKILQKSPKKKGRADASLSQLGGTNG
jgi:hypothetical protein